MRALIAPTLLAALAAAPATSQEPAHPFPAFSIRLGGYFVTSDTRLGLGAELDDELSEVDFEEDFDLSSDETLAAVRLEWHPGEGRHMFRVGYYDLSRSGRQTLAERDITWGDVTYPVGAEVSTTFDQRTYELDWTWWLLRRERGGFGPVLGVTVLDLDARATALITSGPLSLELTESASSTVPVPTIGLAGRFQPASKLWIGGEVRVLEGIEYDEVEGDALIVEVGLEWLVLEHLSLGASWNRFDIDARLDEDAFDGTLDLETTGVQLYGRLVFD